MPNTATVERAVGRECESAAQLLTTKSITVNVLIEICGQVIEVRKQIPSSDPKPREAVPRSFLGGRSLVLGPERSLWERAQVNIVTDSADEIREFDALLSELWVREDTGWKALLYEFTPLGMRERRETLRWCGARPRP